MTEFELRVINLLTVLVNGQVALMLCHPQRAEISEMIAHQRALADLLVAEMPGAVGKQQTDGQ